MRLSELEPKFLKWIDDRLFQDEGVSREQADGVMFLCPKCLAANNGKQPGVHSIICWQPNVPQTTDPKPGRWRMQGKGLEDLTLVAGSSSILLTSGCKAHFFIQQGEIRF